MSYPLEVPVGSIDAQEAPPQRPNKQSKLYNPADLEEYCLWLYGLYEDELIKSV